jgi:hypothetical protein
MRTYIALANTCTGVDLVLLLFGDLAPYRIVRSVLRSPLPTLRQPHENSVLVVEEMDVNKDLDLSGAFVDPQLGLLSALLQTASLHICSPTLRSAPADCLFDLETSV